MFMEHSEVQSRGRKEKEIDMRAIRMRVSKIMVVLDLVSMF